MHSTLSKGKISLLLALGGAGAGFLNGFLGAGGGIILIFLLPLLLKDSGVRDHFAFCVTVIFVFCCVSAGFDLLGGADLGNVAGYAIPALIGGFVGALLLDKINTGFLKIIFAGVMIYAGINMMT
jgi:uncharacterized membrane protein YfcA